MNKKILKVIKYLDENSFYEESNLLKRIATPIGDFWESPAKNDEAQSFSEEVEQVRQNEGSYRDFFVNMSEVMDIFYIPKHLCPRGTDMLPSQDIGVYKLPISDSDFKDIVENYIKGTQKAYYDKNKREYISYGGLPEKDITEYFKWLFENIKTDRVNIVWGAFDSENSEQVDFSPEWLAHDILHAFEAVTTWGGAKEFRLLSDKYAESVKRGIGINTPNFTKFKNLIDEHTTDVAIDDLNATLFGLQITNNVPDSIKECFNTVEDYNKTVAIAMDLINKSQGHVIFLP